MTILKKSYDRLGLAILLISKGQVAYGQEELGKIRRLLKDEIYKRDEKENGNI